MSEAPKSVLLVGHCGPDSWALKMAMSRVAKDVRVEFVHDQEALDTLLPGADLLLINRVLDGGFSVENGIELIRQYAAAGATRPKLMLISNYADAQAAAVGAGGMPGFGKAEMNSARARDLVVQALTHSAPRGP